MPLTAAEAVPVLRDAILMKNAPEAPCGVCLACQVAFPLYCKTCACDCHTARFRFLQEQWDRAIADTAHLVPAETTPCPDSAPATPPR